MDRRAFMAIVGGSILTGPLITEGQQPPTIPMVGYLSARSPEDTSHLVAAFRGGLSQEGFVEGQNVAIEYRWAQGNYDRAAGAGGGACSSARQRPCNDWR
jgi:putative ABC transport system substrate-binding protein